MRYYLDTEFDGFGGPLLSLALVREDGESFYAIDRATPASDPWVRENVLPIMRACPVAPAFLDMPDCGAALAWFLRGDPDPVIVTDWPADIRYFCGFVELPGGNMLPIPALKFELHRVDAYPTTLPGAVQHNAWWDAMALRHLLMSEETARCMACSAPFRADDLVLDDASGGTLHAACCGPERESYTNANGDPLGPDDPIPTGYPWRP